MNWLPTQEEGDKEFEAVKEDVLKKDDEAEIFLWMLSHAASYQAHEDVEEVDPKNSSWNAGGKIVVGKLKEYVFFAKKRCWRWVVAHNIMRCKPEKIVSVVPS